MDWTGRADAIVGMDRDFLFETTRRSALELVQRRVQCKELKQLEGENDLSPLSSATSSRTNITHKVNFSLFEIYTHSLGILYVEFEMIYDGILGKSLRDFWVFKRN